MNKLTKEQVRLFTVIPSVLMIVAFFIKIDLGMMLGGYRGSYGVSLWDCLTSSAIPVGFLGTLILLLFLLVPIYLILFAYRDTKSLEPLKPIMKISPKVAYIIPIVMFVGLIVIGAMYASATPIWLYLLGAIAIYFIGTSLKAAEATEEKPAAKPAAPAAAPAAQPAATPAAEPAAEPVEAPAEAPKDNDATNLA